MDTYIPYQPKTRMAPSIHHPLLRNWNCSNTCITADSLMYPIFLIEDDNGKEEISSMPGVFRFGINQLLIYLEGLVKNNLKSILLFGVINNLPKDEVGTHGSSSNNPVVRAIPHIKTKYPHLVIACDVCLCAYTSHGHCGILQIDGKIDNDKSIARLRDVAVSYAHAGADIVAPSDMMDGRIGAIRQGLRAAGLNHVTILSYAAKFSSNFYGPFRDAAKSAPAFGDRKCYQLPPGSSGLAQRAVARDVEEGADMLMVKPGLPYLDIMKSTKDQYPHHPLFVYQKTSSETRALEEIKSQSVRPAEKVVDGGKIPESYFRGPIYSVQGEFAMLYHAAKAGALDLRKAVEETMTSFRRAGADCIITYFTPQLLEWMQPTAS